MTKCGQLWLNYDADGKTIDLACILVVSYLQVTRSKVEHNIKKVDEIHKVVQTEPDSNRFTGDLGKGEPRTKAEAAVNYLFHLGVAPNYLLFT